MALSTGRTAIRLEFDNGDSETIYIDTHDRGIRERIAAFGDKIDQRIKEVDAKRDRIAFNDGIELNVAGVDDILALSPEQLDEFSRRLDAITQIEDEYNKAVKEELDVVFGSEMSAAVFKYCEPLDIVTEGGEKEIYVMHFLKWFAKEVERMNAGNSAAVQKYIDRYAKK